MEPIGSLPWSEVDRNPKQVEPVHTFTPYLTKNHFSIILPAVTRFSK
jgi:hypothetical protein